MRDVKYVYFQEINESVTKRVVNHGSQWRCLIVGGTAMGVTFLMKWELSEPIRSRHLSLTLPKRSEHERRRH